MQMYRYVNYHDRIYLEAYKVIKTTPKGVWIDMDGCGGKRFVLLDARKHFACPTKEEALISFRARKARQILLLGSQIRNAKAALAAAQTIPWEAKLNNGKTQTMWDTDEMKMIWE